MHESYHNGTHLGGLSVQGSVLEHLFGANHELPMCQTSGYMFSFRRWPQPSNESRYGSVVGCVEALRAASRNQPQHYRLPY